MGEPDDGADRSGPGPRVVAIVPARLGSSRFPGKVLAELDGRSLLEHVVTAARRARRVHQVVVATTAGAGDDQLVARARALGVTVWRGSEADVLGRFYDAAAAYRAQVAVRLTGDNPLVPPEVIDRVIERHLEAGADYTCNFLPPTFPDGFEVEAVSFPILEHLHHHVTRPEDREHVTLYMRTHPADFHIENVAAEEGRSELCLSIDTLEDLERVRGFCAGIGSGVSDRPAVDCGPVRLCAPLSEVFERNRDAVLPLTAAVSYKEPSEVSFPWRECLLESSLNLLAPGFPEQVAALLPALETGKYRSFAGDLGPNCGRWRLGESPNGFPRYLPEGDILSEGEALDILGANVRFLRERLPVEIKVENLNYFPTGAYEWVCEPEAISRCLSSAGIELLLDLAHALISAHNLGCDAEDYLSRLPLDCVSELHVSRAGLVGGIWEDTHEVPEEREFELMEFVLARAPVELVTLEYYRDDAPYVKGLRELHGWLAARCGGVVAAHA